MLLTQDPSLIPHGISVRAASVVELSAQVAAQGQPGTDVWLGPLLALDVSEALLAAAKRQRGLLMKVGHASSRDALLLSLLIRAGRHIAMCVADLGDLEVQACALAALHQGRLPLLLRSPSTLLVTVSELSNAARTTLDAARGCRITSTEEFAGAARQHLNLLADDDFLRQQGIDVRRVRSRTLLLHPPGEIAGGSTDRLEESTSSRFTLH